MKKFANEIFTGERALYNIKEVKIYNSVFCDGESPLKECYDIYLKECVFKWKYPLWYGKKFIVDNCVFEEMSRSGIWYTEDIKITNSVINAPKMFRKATDIILENVDFTLANETLWSCKNVVIKDVNINNADYFGINSENIEINNMILNGNYGFDGGKNIIIRNSKLYSKDAFWNTENVIIYDSIIIGEYLAWNSKNIKFVRCTIESNQGMCYIDDLVLEDCILINTDLAFEFCSVNATISSTIESIKNPISGYIKAKKINQIILDETLVDINKIKIEEEE